MAIVGLSDQVCERIVGIRTGQHLLHREVWARPAGDDRLDPLFDGIIFFAPVMLLCVPHALIFEAEWHKAERGHIEAGGSDFSGKVRVARVAPLLAWFDRDDLAGHDIPESARPERDDALASQQATASRALLDQECHQLDGPAQVEIFGGGLVLSQASRGCRSTRWKGLESEPLAVCGHVARARRPR